MIPAEKKARIVLSVLAGEVTIVQAARKEKVSEQSISRWEAEFLEAGKTALRNWPIPAIPGCGVDTRGHRWRGT